MIRGIKFTGIPVHNQDASLKFYTEKLGFKVVTDQPFTVGILRRCRSHFRYCNRADPGGEISPSPSKHITYKFLDKL